MSFFLLLILDLFFRSFILLTSLDYKGYSVHWLSDVLVGGTERG